jgi:hypothetical protein
VEVVAPCGVSVARPQGSLVRVQSTATMAPTVRAEARTKIKFITAQQGELLGDERAAAAAVGGRGEPGIGAVEVLVRRESEQVCGDGVRGDGKVAVAGAEGFGRLDELVHAGWIRDGEVLGDPGGAHGSAEAATREADGGRGCSRQEAVQGQCGEFQAREAVDCAIVRVEARA